MQFVATAHQLGPVNYRDPLGVISPSGEWLAYSVAQHLYVQAIQGGTPRELTAAGAIIRHIAWLPDSKSLAIDSPESVSRWWVYDVAKGTRSPLWEPRPPQQVKRESLEQLAWSKDGKSIAAIARKGPATELWILSADGSNGKSTASTASLSFPAWMSDGRVGCLARENGKQTLSIPCGSKGTQEAYGALAFSPDGRTVYFGVPNPRGTLDLWSRLVAGGVALQHTQFTRDTYAPSVSADGTVLFKLQDYRTFVGLVPAEGGATRQVTTFQSETPSFHPDGKSLGVTYGTWRRIVDDINYPDISQEVGTVSLTGALPAREPSKVVHASKSEDQSLCWSPNGKWIAFHSHKDLSDDIWLQPADGSAQPRLITHFGRGAEAGWPRWSADGKTILLDAGKPGSDPRRAEVFTVEVDQNTGVTQKEKELLMDGFDEDATHVEWGGDGQSILVQSFRFPAQQTFYRMPRSGGKMTKLFGFASEQKVPGFGVSPDGKSIAYVAPAADGFMQIFRSGLDGKGAKQVTLDRSHKTQPAWSPDGKQIAFTVWNYDGHFWVMRP